MVPFVVPALAGLSRNRLKAELRTQALQGGNSLERWRDRSKLGMAIVAMIRMMATTISSSSNENPLCLIWLLVASCEPVAIIITTGPNCSWNYCTGLPDKVPGKQGVHVPVVVVW